ncbi:unnamed protein product [Merluccius merluccius]
MTGLQGWTALPTYLDVFPECQEENEFDYVMVEPPPDPLLAPPAPPLAPSAPPQSLCPTDSSLAPSAPPQSLCPQTPIFHTYQRHEVFSDDFDVHVLAPSAPPQSLFPPTDSHNVFVDTVGSLEEAAGGPPPQPAPPPVPKRKNQLRHQKRFSCDLTVSPRKLTHSITVTDNQETWNVKLIDAPQGSTKSLAAFCMSTSMLAVKFPYKDRGSNAGVVRAHLSCSSPVMQQQVTFTVASNEDNCSIPFPTPLNKTAKHLIDAIGDVMDIPDNTRGYYVLKLCDSDEYLQRDEALGDHESIQRYHKFNQDVPLRLLHVTSVDHSLARDEEDDKAPCHLYKYLGSACVFSISRVNVTALVELVRTISSLLCGVSSQQLEEALGMLNRAKPTNMTSKEMEDCETVIVMMQQALVQLLQVVFDSFQSDFRGPAVGRDSLPRRIEENTEILQFTMAALYKLQPAWLNSFDYFSISCVLTHGGKKICEAGVSENISTALSLGNTIQCNRKMVFPVLVTKVPYETMLTVRLLGCKQGRSQEPLRWAVLPLFSCSTLVNGTVLLGMSSLGEPPGLPTPALSDSHQLPAGVILQLDFPNEFEWRYQRPEAVPGTVLFSEPFEELQKKMSALSKKHCLCFLTENERTFLWTKRYCANPRSTFLHLLLGGAPGWKPEDLPEIYSVVAHWPITSPEEALFLLSDSIHDVTVRRAAVQFFEQRSHGELMAFLPQLVQALRNEWALDGALVMLLLDRSVRNIRIAQQLYWLLVDAAVDPYYQGWFGKVLAALKHCCGRALRKELERQTQLVVLLTQVATMVRLAEKTRRKEVLEREKWKINDFFKDGMTCRLPLDAACHVKAVDVDACKFYNSNAAPLGISFICTDPLARKISVICKTGDSLRQDGLIMQIVRVMDRVWLEEGLDMCMVTYRCLSTGKDQGLVEVVQDAVTLAQIQQEWGLGGALRQDTLEKWFHMRNITKDSYEKAVHNFLSSCAGWCVATFILGICDRHNDNIMLKHSGHMFHIDFGKIMGNVQKFANIKRDRVPFIFSSEMQHFITGGGHNPQRLHDFVERCCKAYNVIRRRSALVLSLLELMLGAGLPEMKDIGDLKYVHKNLRPEDSDMEATSYFTKKIKKSMNCLTVKLNFLSHSLAQGKKAGAQGPTHSPAPSTSSNIQQVVIQKYTTVGKTVTFEVQVTIDDGYLNIKKTFGQFELIHKELQKHFIESTIPQFPCWYQMSFRPSRKMTMLNKYFKELFNGPCKGNEFVCSLFLDGPKTSEVFSINEESPQIQLYISYAENKLSILVKHLKNIRIAKVSNPDVYVVLHLKQDHQKSLKRKTEVVRNNNPTFNELLEYPNVPLLPNTMLEVDVKCKKKVVAKTTIQLGDDYLDKENWLPLCNSYSY